MKGLLDVFKVIGVLSAIMITLYFLGSKFEKPEFDDGPHEVEEKEVNPRTVHHKMLIFGDSTYIVSYKVDSVYSWHPFHKKGK